MDQSEQKVSARAGPWRGFSSGSSRSADGWSGMHNWNKLLQSLRIALRSLLRDFPSGINTASLRASMQVHAHMYHRFGLLPPSGMSFCSSLLPDSGGGQRSYGIKWLRAPETTENALYTLLFAKQPEATLRGTAPGIGSPGLCPDPATRERAWLPILRASERFPTRFSSGI